MIPAIFTLSKISQSLLGTTQTINLLYATPGKLIYAANMKLVMIK